MTREQRIEQLMKDGCYTREEAVRRVDTFDKWQREDEKRHGRWEQGGKA